MIIALVFALINALRGAGKIDRLTSCFLMAVCLNFGGYADWICTLEWLLLDLAFLQGWCLASLNPLSERDWDIKFPPTKWFRVGDIENIYLYGAVGMYYRWMVFIPVIVVIHGWIGLLEGVELSMAVGVVYYLSGTVCRHIKKPQYSDMLANFVAGALLGAILGS